MKFVTTILLLKSSRCTFKHLVIRRECGQTLARVRISRTYISIIIISLQWTKG